MYYVKSTGMANVLLIICTANMFVNKGGECWSASGLFWLVSGHIPSFYILYIRTHMVFDTLFPLLLVCMSFVALVFNSRSTKLRDVIVLPYGRVQTAQTRYPYTAACALRDKMAAHFVLLFVKPSQRYAEIIQMLVVWYGKSDAGILAWCTVAEAMVGYSMWSTTAVTRTISKKSDITTSTG